MRWLDELAIQGNGWIEFGENIIYRLDMATLNPELMELMVKVPDLEDKGAALDWILEQYKKEDLVSIVWVEEDEDGNHVFQVTLRSIKKTKADE